MKRRSVLVATLGRQPQIVTFALDAFLERGIRVDEVIVVHLGSADYLRALRRLAEAFPGDRYAGERCHLRPAPIYDGKSMLSDIRDERAVAVVWRAIYELIRGLKEEGVQLHLLLTGGRRMMALLAVSAAMLQLEPGDRIWHIYTPDALQEQARFGARLHAPDEAGVALLEAPIAPLGSYFPALRALTTLSPEDVLASQTRWLDDAERAKCREVWERLTERQREVLRAFAQGLDREEAARALGISVRTVDSHKSVILDECHNAWSLPAGERLTYHFIQRKFEKCLASLV